MLPYQDKGSNSGGTMSRLHKMLKDKRVARGLTQKEVSDALGYSTAQFISNWERGLSSPPLNALAVLADMYKIPPKDFIQIMMDEQEALLKAAFSPKTRRKYS